MSLLLLFAGAGAGGVVLTPSYVYVAVVAAEDRNMSVAYESRTSAVASETRTAIVPPDSRES